MISVIVNNLISDLKPRQKDVLTSRFGLNDGNKKTLESIGEKYDITRERVRQVENEALKIIQEKLTKKEKLINEIKELVANHLGDLGGLRSDDLLIRELKFILKDNDFHHWHLRFFSEIVGQPLYYSESRDFHNFWHLGKKYVQTAKNFISQFKKIISNKKEQIITHNKFHDFYIDFIKNYKLPEFVGLNYLSVSRQFGINPYGDCGLSHWEEIALKTVKDKAYLVLKKHGNPLHFKTINDLINEIHFDDKKTLSQTVHNELIKYPCFVLVGRGTYGLKEYGFEPGATCDIIYQILKKQGPLSVKEIVDAVNKQRLLKENTILLNLQDKKRFKKLEDGRYATK